MLLHRFISLITLSAIASAAGAETIAAIESRMDQAAPAFTSLSAKLKKSSYTKIIKDETTETGTILIKRVKPGDTRVKLEFKGADERVAVFHDRKYEVYLPKLKIVQQYDLKQYGNLVDQFMLLGFGTSGKSLLQSYTMKVLKQEEIAAQQTTRIELLPVSKEAKEHLTKIEMWIPEGKSYPLQQRLYFPSGNYDTVTYSDLKINEPIAEKALKLEVPKGVKTEYPQR